MAGKNILLRRKFSFNYARFAGLLIFSQINVYLGIFLMMPVVDKFVLCIYYNNTTINHAYCSIAISNSIFCAIITALFIFVIIVVLFRGILDIIHISRN